MLTNVQGEIRRGQSGKCVAVASDLSDKSSFVNECYLVFHKINTKQHLLKQEKRETGFLK